MKTRFYLCATVHKDGVNHTIFEARRLHLNEAQKALEYAFLEGADIVIVQRKQESMTNEGMVELLHTEAIKHIGD